MHDQWIEGHLQILSGVVAGWKDSPRSDGIMLGRQADCHGVSYVSGDRCDEPKLSNDHERSAGPWGHSFGVSADTVRP